MTRADGSTNFAFLSFGGNLGDVASTFAHAVCDLDKQAQSRVLKCSSLWRTKPWGKTDQPDFLNMAVSLSTNLPALELLEFCLGLETKAGRIREELWGPRSLDIDIIAFGSLETNTEVLILPHPRAHERAFVLAPLAEIAPDALLHGNRIDTLLHKLQETLPAGECVRDAIATDKFRSALV